MIEIVLTIALLALLLVLAIPNFAIALANAEVRVSAETLAAGLQVARNQAIANNQSVSLFLVDTLDNNCQLSSSGPNWIVAVDDPQSRCASPAAPDVVPRIFQKKAGAEGGRGVKLSATAAGMGASVVRFNSLGRVTGTVDGVLFDLKPSGDSRCEHEGGDIRCLRVQASLGGVVRLCDPKISSAEDPRQC